MFFLSAIKVRERQPDTQEPAVEIRVRLQRMDDGLRRVAKGRAVLPHEGANFREGLRAHTIWGWDTVDPLT